MKAQTKTKNDLMAEVAELRAKLEELEKPPQRRQNDDPKRGLDAMYNMNRFPEENPNPVMRVSTNDELLYANRPAIEMLEAMGWQKGGVLPEALSRSIRSAPEKNTDRGFELVCARNRVFSFALSANAAEGDINLYGLDITSRKRAEEALRRSERRYRSFIEVTNEWAWVTDPAGQVVEDIPALRAFTGQTYDQAKGAGWAEALHPDDVQRTLEVWNRAVTTRTPYETEYRMRRKDGIYRLLLARGVPILDDQGRVIEWVGTCIDITERKKAEEALRKAHDELEVRVQERTADLKKANEKLRESEKRLKHLSSQLLKAQEEERRRIAVDVHDSLGSGLAAIKFKLEKIASQFRAGEREKAELEETIGSVQRCGEECRRIQTDLRPLMLDDLGILATIRWVCREYEKTYPIRIEQQMDIQEDDISAHLKIVIYRILQEALHNIAKHSHSDLVGVSLRKNESEIQFTIQDNGRGFSREEMASKAGTGRGLGLSSMKERTEFLGGSFEIETAVGKGTTIRISWPLA